MELVGIPDNWLCTNRVLVHCRVVGLYFDDGDSAKNGRWRVLFTPSRVRLYEASQGCKIRAAGPGIQSVVHEGDVSAARGEEKDKELIDLFALFLIGRGYYLRLFYAQKVTSS